MISKQLPFIGPHITR